jgi:restriction system protein
MKKYYRVMLGAKSAFADEAYKGNFVAAGFIKDRDLTRDLSENRRDFNKKFIPIWLQTHPDKTKVSAGLACGMLWTVAKGLQLGDVVLCPDGKGNYYVGEVSGGYEYHKGHSLPHRRPVRWFAKTLTRDDMSDALKHSAGSIGTVSDLTDHADELEKLLSGNAPQAIVATDASIEDPSIFALEKHLEDFLVQNWKSTELGKRYDIYEEDGEMAGQQYPSDTGPIDILAISKDKKELLVVELKKGRVSDMVVGQTQRYMGYVKDELAEKGQSVRGVIIALEDDIKIRRALAVASNIDFYTYKMHFKLEKR